MSDEDRLKAIIGDAMKAHGYDTLRTHRRETGRWDASVHGDDGKSWIASCNRRCEVDALVSLAKAIGVDLP